MVVLIAAAATVAWADPRREHFESRVRPVLAEQCFECHSAGAKKLKGGLRLDTASGLKAGGESGPVIVPGDPGASRLIQAVSYQHVDLQMPPKSRLAADQIAALTEWVRQGAYWPADAPGSGAAQRPSSEPAGFDLARRKAEHWMWQPVERPPAPAVRHVDWPLDDLDRFILSELESRSITPAPDADRRTLIRRLTFDLTGLPPTPAEIDAWLADTTQGAMERLVDRLLASPRFGERWARHWMDLVRYAETYGHEFDYPLPDAWRYRDYLIRAINADVPYDQLVTEHIAGDLLHRPRLHPMEGTNESVIATAFWFFHEQTHAPVDVRQHQADRIDNQIDMLGKTFLAATIACARCHDHKFDAISARDYYALAGYLASSRQQRTWLDDGTIDRAAGELARLHQSGRELIGSAAPAPVAAAPQGEQVVFETFDSADYRGWFVSGWAFGAGPTCPGDWDRQASDPRPAQPGVADSGALAARLRGAIRSRTFRIEHPSVHVLARGKGRVRLVVDGLMMTDYHQLLFKGTVKEINSRDRWAWITLSGDLVKYLGHRGHLEIIDDDDEAIAVDEIRFGGESPGSTPTWKPEPIQLDDSARSRLRQIAAEMERIDRSLPSPASTPAIGDGNGIDERVFIRGSHRTLGALAPRRFLEAIAGANQPAAPEQGSGRLELAGRLVDPANPLTSRVMVNRLWHHLMGRGIVPTVDDFGKLGQPPTHPRLLDHLAATFVSEGWSIKAMIRRIALSRTYRMSSRGEPGAEAADPTNALFHRANVRRLEGEAIRDAMLAVSGRLDERMFGPPVAVHLTSFMDGRGRPQESGPLDGAGRRSVYLEVRRNFLPPMMLAFDTPLPFSTVGRRSVSNVPAQALILMNDPLVTELAGAWAERSLREDRVGVDVRVERLYVAALGRPPYDEELRQAGAFVTEHAAELGLSADQAAQDPRVWKDFCHVLFNVKDFVFLH
jgi:hypothetical protein